MRCETCGYRLWNLPSRTCPECGTEFLPSRYEFVANSVRFCCPHCGEGYYGTGPKGHLVPASFDCASCGRHVHMDEMVLLPTAGVEEEQTQVDRMPWLQRKRSGFFRAWFSTIGMALIHPIRLMRAVPKSSSPGQALRFAVLTNTLTWSIGFGPLMMFPMIVVGLSSTTGARAIPVLEVLAIAGVMVLFAAGGTFAFLAGWGAVAHGLLRATGSTAGTIGRTYQAIGYAAGANIMTAVPCIGYYFGWIWWVVSAVLMVKEGQRVQGWRATFAVLTFPALLLFTGVVIYAVLVASLILGARPPAGP